MIIAHCTDLHITPNGESNRGIDVRKNVEQVFKDIKQYKPDLLILGGDLAANDGEISSYEWLRNQLDSLTIPYLIIPGNHDRVDNLSDVFELSRLKKDGLYYRHNASIICLDTSKAFISETQFSWLKNRIEALTSENLVFLHHPPLDCQCLFMDRKYPLQNRNQVFELFRNSSEISNLFCGHYHTERTVITENITIFITPATMMQIDPQSDHYRVISTRPGWRLINWHPGYLSTHVLYP